MIDISKFTVVIAELIDDNTFSTFGNGILVSKSNKIYVVTCRHVAMYLSPSNTSFIIPDPHKQTSMLNAYKISSPIYYDDTEPYTDLCVMEVDGSPIRNNGLNFITLGLLQSISADASVGDIIESSGYLCDSMVENKPDEMIPLTISEGRVVKANLSTDSFRADAEFKCILSPSSFTYAHTWSLIKKGQSGSPVSIKDSGKLCGILAASQTVPYEQREIDIFLFTPISSVLNLLNRL